MTEISANGNENTQEKIVKGPENQRSEATQSDQQHMLGKEMYV